MKRRAVVCGGIAWNRMIHLDRFPDPVPATIFPTRTIDAVGSSGAGKAMNFASLGWDVTFWTPVGDDDAGDRAVAEVEATGVEVIRFPDSAGTGEHVNLMDATGERISIFARSGSFELDIPVDEVCSLFDGQTSSRSPSTTTAARCSTLRRRPASRCSSTSMTTTASTRTTGSSSRLPTGCS